VSGAALTSREEALDAARNFPTFVAFGILSHYDINEG
jgi:hypothetical protein